MGKPKGIVVGCGRAGEVLNLQPLQQEGADIVAVCDPFEELGRKVQRRNKVRHFYKSMEEAIEQHPDLDFACIATPQQLHYDQCKYCLEKGLHVLVEKPYTVTIAEAEKLEKIAKKAKRKIVVVHNHKFVSGVQEALALYKAGKIGKLLRIDRAWMISGHTDRMVQNEDFWAHKLVGGKWAEVFPHAIYIPLMFLDTPPKLEYLSAKKFNKKWPWLSADQVNVTLSSGDVYVNMYFTAELDRKTTPENAIVLYGTKGVIYANYGNARLVAGIPEQAKTMESVRKIARMVKRKYNPAKKKYGVGSGHAFQSNQFLQYIQGKIKEPPVSGFEAIETMRLSDQLGVELDKAVKKLKNKPKKKK